MHKQVLPRVRTFVFVPDQSLTVAAGSATDVESLCGKGFVSRPMTKGMRSDGEDEAVRTAGAVLRTGGTNRLYTVSGVSVLFPAEAEYERAFRMSACVPAFARV